MKNRKEISIRYKTVILSALFLALGIGAWYGAEFLAPEQAPQVALAKDVTLTGEVSPEELNLSGTEIRELNQCAHDNAGAVRHMELSVNYGKDFRGMSPDSVLAWALILNTTDGSVVRSWPREAPRRELVGQVVKQVSKAIRDYRELKKYPDVIRNLKQIYI